MANTIVVKDLLQKETIHLKDRKTIIKQAANTKYQGELRKQGDTVSVETFPNVFGNIGGTAGADISTTDWTITSEDLKVDQVYQNGAEVKDIEDIQSNLALRSRLSSRFAYASADHEDRFVASFSKDALTANKKGYHSPLSLAAGTTYSAVTSLSTALQQQNAFSSSMLFVSPAIHEKMLLENILGSTEKGLGFRLNGSIGQLNGFDVMVTNNLQHSVLLTMDTVPVNANADTMVIAGLEQDTTNGGYKERNVTFTFLDTAASAGDVAIGANVAATQVNLVAAINGTGTPGSGTYIALAAADRTAIKNAMIHAETTWTSDAINIYSNKTMTVSETFTVGTNVFGSDATLMLAVDSQAINFVSQLDQFKVPDVPTGFRANVLQEKVYGGKVFSENSKGIATYEIAV